MTKNEKRLLAYARRVGDWCSLASRDSRDWTAINNLRNEGLLELGHSAEVILFRATSEAYK